jgi:KRAB domain-containing zinc finger protein
MKKLFLILTFAIIHASDILDEQLIPEESFLCEQLSPSRVLDDFCFANSVLPSSQLNLHLSGTVSQATVSNGECIFCLKSFARKNYLLRHLVSSHANNKGFLQHFTRHGGKPEKIHHCSKCSFTTLDKTHFAQHAARHSGEKLYYCNLCPRGFNLANDLRRHKFSIHHEDVADFKSYECSKCAASFTKNKLLINHMAKHEETTKSSLVVCKVAKTIKKDCKLPTQATCRPRSQKSSSSKSSKCTDLQKATVPIVDDSLTMKNPSLPIASKGLELLAECKSADVKNEFYKVCPECGLSTKSNANLLVHMARHQKKPLYFCELCPWGCYLKNDLSRHIISKHPGQANPSQGHVCKDCQQIFPRKENLVKHNTKVHQITFSDFSAQSGV